jgi:hypothetical protein
MMDEKQAQELAQIVRLKSRAWMEDDLYGAFLRADIFGSLPLKVNVGPAEKGEGCAVFAHWEYLDECFPSREEWEAFAARIEERMGLAALSEQGESELRGGLNP